MFALSICIYGFYVLLSPNFTNPIDNDLDKTTMFLHKDRQTSSNAKNTEASHKINHKQIRPDKLMMHKKSINILTITESWLDNSWTDNELVITGSLS